jgi:hypothetical protein
LHSPNEPFTISEKSAKELTMKGCILPWSTFLFIYSVWALDITRKKSYQACKNCKRPAERKEMNLFECIYCKKIVDTILTHALCVNFADFTGSCSIDVIGEHA